MTVATRRKGAPNGTSGVLAGGKHVWGGLGRATPRTGGQGQCHQHGLSMGHHGGMGSSLSDVRLRRAEPNDNDAVATVYVHVRSWQAAYRVPGTPA